MRLRCMRCSLSLFFFYLKYFIVKSASLIFLILQVHVITAYAFSIGLYMHIIVLFDWKT